MEIKASDSLSTKRQMIQAALDKKRKGKKSRGGLNVVGYGGGWIRDVFPKHAIVEEGENNCYAYRYTIKGDKALLGKKIPVEVVYRAKQGVSQDDWNKVVDRS